MAVLEMLRRAFMNAGVPTTESVQRAVMNWVDGHGPSHASQLYEGISFRMQPGHLRNAIDQAAQILVNQRLVVAFRNGHAVDPIYAMGDYTLAFPSDVDAPP